MDDAAILTILRITKTKYHFQLTPPDQRMPVGGGARRSPIGVVAQITVDSKLRAQWHTAITGAMAALHNNNARILGEDAGRANESLARPLLELGSLLYRLLLPPSIQQALSSLAHDIPLILATDDLEWPWELLHDGSGFLALQRAVGRQWLRTTAPHRPPPAIPAERSCLMITTDPKGDLPESAREADRLMDLFDKVEGTIKFNVIGNKHATKFAVRTALANGSYDLIHYSGHAEAGGLLLADGILTAEEIQASMQGHPFVFFNGCRSAQSEPAADGLPYAGLPVRNLATTFLQKGASGFIGALWPIFDESSRYFAEWFYTLLLAGNSVGEALRHTRERLYIERHADPLWASYVFYGDPTLRLMWGQQRALRTVALLTIHMKEAQNAFAAPVPAAALQRASAFSDLLAGIAQHYGGTLSTALPHLWQIGLGLARTQEDDSLRAIHIAQDLLRSLQTFSAKPRPDFPQPSHIGIGVSQGEAQVTIRQTGSTASVELLGAAVERSITLAQQAHSGEIWIDAATQQLIQRAYHCEPINRSNQPASFRVGDARQSTSTTPLIGRESQLVQLHSWWRDALAGQGQWVAVAGDPGLGKSRLLQTFRAAVTSEGARCITVTCLSYERAVSFALWARLIRTAAHIEHDDKETVQRAKLAALVSSFTPAQEERKQDAINLLSQMMGLRPQESWLDRLTPEQKQQKLIALLQAVLRQEAAQLPLLLLLEDLHWMDDASAAIFAQVVAGITHQPLLVLVSYRPNWENDWRPSGQYHLVTLKELNNQEQQALFATLLPETDVAPVLIEPLLKLTGGNPLYIEEMVNYLQVKGILQQTGHSWRWRETPTSTLLPKTLEQLLRARFDTLDALRREAAQKAAVIGERFEYIILDQLEDVAGRSQLERTLEMLVTQALIYPTKGWLPPEITYDFRHSLMQQTIYLTISERVRRPLHRLVAQVLVVNNGALDLIAYHYQQSDDPIQAIVYSLRANQGWGQVNPKLALQRYDTVLTLLENLSNQPAFDQGTSGEASAEQQLRWKLEAYTGKGDLLSQQGNNNEAIQWYEQALALTDNSENRVVYKADLYYRIAQAQQARGDFDAALSTIALGLRLVGAQKSPEAGRLQIWHAFLHFKQGRLAEALTPCIQGITILEALGDRDQPLAQGYNLRGLLYHDRGQPEEALTAYKKSITLYQEIKDLSGQVRAYNNRAVLYQDWGRWADALTDLAQAATFARQTEEAWWEAGSLINQAEIYRYQGELPQAMAANETALTIGKTHDLAEIVGLAQMNLGVCWLKLGELEPAATQLAAAITIFTEHAAEHLSEAHCHLAELYTQQNQPDRAFALAQAALTQCEEQIQIGRLHRVLGRANRQRQRLAEAQEHLDKSRATFETGNFRYELGLTWLEWTLLYQTLAGAGDDTDNSLHKQAIESCAQALAIFTDLGAKLDLAHAQEIRQSL